MAKNKINILLLSVQLYIIKMAKSKWSHCDNFITTIPAKRNISRQQSNRFSTLFNIIQFILVISVNKNRITTSYSVNTDDSHAGFMYDRFYHVPFTAENILTVFTSEPIEIKVTNDPFNNFILTWSYTTNVNNLQHMTHGNGRTSYNIMSWNCRKGLIQNKDEDTDTFIEIKNLIQEKKPHILGVIEADIWH